MRIKAHKIDITPDTHNLHRWIQQLTKDSIQKGMLDSCVKAWFYANSFSGLTGDDIIRLIEGTLTITKDGKLKEVESCE